MVFHGICGLIVFPGHLQKLLQILNNLGLFAFNLISITIFMMPAVFFLKLKVKKIFFNFFNTNINFFSLYIYGNHSINKNQKLI